MRSLRKSYLVTWKTGFLNTLPELAVDPALHAARSLMDGAPGGKGRCSQPSPCDPRGQGQSTRAAMRTPTAMAATRYHQLWLPACASASRLAGAHALAHLVGADVERRRTDRRGFLPRGGRVAGLRLLGRGGCGHHHERGGCGEQCSHGSSPPRVRPARRDATRPPARFAGFRAGLHTTASQRRERWRIAPERVAAAPRGLSGPAQGG
jgi:hypothetical protein